jgi:hypothetical protein
VLLDEFAEQPGILPTTIDGGQNWNKNRALRASLFSSRFFAKPLNQAAPSAD